MRAAVCKRGRIPSSAADAANGDIREIEYSATLRLPNSKLIFLDVYVYEADSKLTP